MTHRLTRRALIRRTGAVAGAVGLMGVPGTAAALSAPSAAVGAGTAAIGGGAAALQLARVWPTAAQRHLLAAFDDTHVVFGDGSLELLLWPGDQARLATTGMRFEVTVPDLVARDTALHAAEAARGRQVGLALQPGETSDGQYRVLEDFNTDMLALEAAFPDLARRFELPNKSIEGRTVYGIEITKGVRGHVDGRPVYYHDGVHHAREWPAGEFPMMWAFDLCEGYGNDPLITRLVDDVRHIIVPIVNVDGYTFSRSALIDAQGVGNEFTGNAYWRKNRRQDSTSPLRDIDDSYGTHGIDNNRNYAYAWGDNIGGSSSSRTSETFRGPNPFSEPETRNTSYLMRTTHPTAMITHHTSGDLILWAWGDTSNDAPDNDLLEGLGRAMATFNDYTPQKSIDLYETTGTCSDYAYGVVGSIGYTFEHAGSSFHPNYATTVPGQYAMNRAAFILLGMEACVAPERRPAARPLPAQLFDPEPAWEIAPYDAAGLNHAVLSGRTVDADGQGIQTDIRLRKVSATLLWKDGDGTNPTSKPSVTEVIDTVITTETDGTFTWHVNPSTRPFLRFLGEEESYTFYAGDQQREVVLDRGQRLDIGDVLATGDGAGQPPRTDAGPLPEFPG